MFCVHPNPLDARDRRFFTLLRISYLQNGQLELGVDVPGFQAKFKSDVELDINTKSISVKSAVDFISSILKRSNNTGRPIVIFIDELDLAHGDDATYNRDAMLIRDLVVVVTRFNDLFNKSKSKIKFITAIRSEVLRSVSTLGKEIYKDAEDLGYEISWDQLGSQARSPLLELVERKIIESEPLDKRSRPDQVWQSYFPPKRKINDEKYLDETDIKRFILHYSWYRPRDIVRMLLGAQSFAGDRTSFNWSDFESDRKTYSQKSWVEHTEELLASYSSEQIAAIKLLLQGAPKSFGFEKFTSICANRSALYESVSRLMRAKQPADVLKDLFRIGIIGNVSNDTRGHTQVRWVFRGDAEILLDRVCVIHRGLWRELSSS